MANEPNAEIGPFIQDEIIEMVEPIDSTNNTPDIYWKLWPAYLALVISLRQWATSRTLDPDASAKCDNTDTLLFVLFDDEGILVNVIGVRSGEYASVDQDPSLAWLLERSDWDEHSIEPLWPGIFQLAVPALENAEWHSIPHNGPIMFTLYRPYPFFFRRGSGQGWMARDIGIITREGAFPTPTVDADLAPEAGYYGL